MTRNLIFVVLLWPVVAVAQEHGIVFSQLSNWEAVSQQAQTEHKYIFVDCYTSWCGPCKVMDKDVYSNDTVGVFMNNRFISVKIQMDSTNKDSKKVQDWRATSRRFEKQYSISAYPSFLFFSPNGDILHEGIGGRDVANFIELARNAMIPEKQYYNLVNKYEHAAMPYEDMRNLANTSKDLLHDSVGNQIAGNYIHHYLEILPQEQLWTKDNIRFIQSYLRLVHSDGRLFQRYFNDREIIDTVMGEPRYSDRMINALVYGEIVDPAIKSSLAQHSEPKWSAMERAIRHKFAREYVEKNILRGRMEFYRTAKEWEKYAKYLVIRFDKAGILNHPANSATFFTLNNIAFEVFKYSNSKKELEKALAWIDRVISSDTSKPSAAALDTKANLLYKLGRKNEGIALEERSAKLAPKDREIQENFSKMKIGAPTWMMD